MGPFAQSKKDALLARKASDVLRATLLATLIAEAGMIGKNDGNHESLSEASARRPGFCRGDA